MAALKRYVMVHYDGRSEIRESKHDPTVWLVRKDGTVDRAYKRVAYATPKAVDNSDEGIYVYAERPMEHVELAAMTRID